MASNFPTAYIRVASQAYVLQHICIIVFCSDYCVVDRTVRLNKARSKVLRLDQAPPVLPSEAVTPETVTVGRYTSAATHTASATAAVALTAEVTLRRPPRDSRRPVSGAGEVRSAAPRHHRLSMPVPALPRTEARQPRAAARRSRDLGEARAVGPPKQTRYYCKTCKETSILATTIKYLKYLNI